MTNIHDWYNIKINKKLCIKGGDIDARKNRNYYGQKNMEEALEILAFLQGLNPRDRNDFQQFLEGVKYGLKLRCAENQSI